MMVNLIGTPVKDKVACGGKHAILRARTTCERFWVRASFGIHGEPGRHCPSRLPTLRASRAWMMRAEAKYSIRASGTVRANTG